MSLASGDTFELIFSLTASHLIFPLCSFQYHSPSHFSPFISPEIVNYAPISLVHVAFSYILFPLICSCTTLFIPSPFINISHLHVYCPLCTSSSLYRNSQHTSHLSPHLHLF